jgi:hypothetical protein
MGAAEDRSHDNAEQAEVPELTPTERARLRALLELLDRAAAGAKVDRGAPARVRPRPEPTAEDFEMVRKIRRRKGLR